MNFFPIFSTFFQRLECVRSIGMLSDVMAAFKVVQKRGKTTMSEVRNRLSEVGAYMTQLRTSTLTEISSMD